MLLSDNIKGISFIIFAVMCFSIMNGVTKHLAETYNVVTLNMFRYWFFALMIVLINSNNKTAIVKITGSKKKYIQIFRGSLLAIQMCFAHYCFLELGLIETSAILSVGPLFVTALAIIFLHEKVDWKRIVAISLGFIGILIILRPGLSVFDPLSIIALACAFAYASYQILTRFVSYYDSANTSFFYTGIAGALILSFVGPFFYVDVKNFDWILILVISILGTTAHYFVIKAYQIAQASVLQPFNYFALVFNTFIGIIFFDEIIEIPVLLGSLIVVLAGLYTFKRESIGK